MGKRKILCVVALALLFQGCGNHPPASPSSLDTARVAIEEAARYDAAQYASSELTTAQLKLTRAEEALRTGKEEQARRLGEQATIDARYAQAKAQAQHEQNAAIDNRTTAATIQRSR